MLVSGLGTIVIAALIGPSYKGTLATLAAVSWMVAVVLSAGMDGAIRYYLATQSWTLRQSNVVILATAALASVLAFLGFSTFHALTPEYVLSDLTTIQLTAATSVTLLGMLSGPALVGIREFGFFARLALAAAVVNPLIFLFLRLIGVPLLPAALWGYIGGQAALAIPAQLRLLKLAGWRFSRPNDARGAAWYGLRSLGTHLFSMANLRLDVIVLRSLSTPAATGAYSLITQLSEAVWLVPSSVGIAAFPEIAEGGHADGRWTARLCRLVTAFSAFAAIAAGGAATLLILFAMPDFREGISALWLLLPGTVAVATSQILTHDLNARRRPQASMFGAGAAVIVTIVGGVALIPSLGVDGAAIVSSAAYLVNTLVLTRYFTLATSTPATALIPRAADTREAARLAVAAAREFLAARRRRSATSPQAGGEVARGPLLSEMFSQSMAYETDTPSVQRQPDAPNEHTRRCRALFAVLRMSGLPFLVRETVQRRRVTIIDYHEIGPEVFDQHLSVLCRLYTPITLRQYVEAVRSGTTKSLPPKSLIITIDDGHRSVRRLAEICLKYSVKPTVFLCSGLVDTSRRFWWMTTQDYEEVEELKRMEHGQRMKVLESRGFTETATFPERVTLSRSEIEATRDVFDFQAHTVFHPILTTCSDDRSRSEITEGRTDLQDRYGLEIWAFAYPNGDYSDREVGYLSEAGYLCAVTCDSGYNGPRTDLYRLKRIGMGDGEGLQSSDEIACHPADANEVIARASGLPAIVGRLFASRR